MPDEAVLDRINAIGALLADLPPEVVGDRLRRLRQRQSLSIRELAARAGISKTSLVGLEKGNRARPTTVLAVCNALGIHIQRVLSPTDDDLQVAVAHHRADDRWHDLRDFGSGVLGGADRPLDAAEREAAAREHGAIPLCMLTSRLPDSAILPSVIELGAPTDVRSHPGSEFVYVLAGCLELTVGDHRYVLAQDESICFRSAEPHRYAPADGATTPDARAFDSDR